jgi:hypothetical protein
MQSLHRLEVARSGRQVNEVVIPETVIPEVVIREVVIPSDVEGSGPTRLAAVAAKERMG